MNRTILFVIVVCLCYGSFFSGYSQTRKRQSKPQQKTGQPKKRADETSQPQKTAQAAAQTRATAESSPLFQVVSVREAPHLELKTSAGFGGGADAGEGRRYVIVRLEFAKEVDTIDNRMLLLVGDDSTLFTSDGLGDEEGKFCAMPGITLKREAEGFGGFCAMTQGGPVSLAWLTTKQPAAAFVVPQSVPLSSLQISYQKKPGVRLK